MANNKTVPEEFATEADKRLWQLIQGDNPRVDEVRAAIEAGANVNHLNPKGQSLLMESLAGEAPEALEIIRLLCDHGADVNVYDEDDFCPLAEAFYGHDPAIIECLLQYRANPNVVVERICPGSVLDIAETDLDFYSMECDRAIENGHDEEAEYNKQACKAVATIVELLKSAGAKPMRDMVATQPRIWLVVFAVHKTGLLTCDGLLDVADLPNISASFCQKFRDWLARYFDTWPDKSFENRPKGFDRAKHNEEGRRLAQEIKRLVGNAVAIDYGYICAEDEAKNDIRNTHWDRNMPADGG